MPEYIEREALLKEVDDLKRSPWYNDDYGNGTRLARHDGVKCVVDLCIKQAPTADVVEVVRCKDCIHAVEHKYSPAFYKCNGCNFLKGRLVSSTFWCKCGERSESA